MESHFLSCDHADEEEYIDMEVSSHNNFFNYHITSPPHPREFEFQMFSSFSERDTTTSPADELFYKGNLLPLHLPPRLEMVQKLLQNPNSYNKRTTNNTFDEFYSTPLATATPTTPESNNTPFESCQVSRELNPDEYFLDYSNEVSENPKKSWPGKLKLIKKSTLGSKLKASRAYIKSIFSKSGCSYDSFEGPSINMDQEPVLKAKKNLRSSNKENVVENGGGCYRRSFSGAIIKRLSTAKVPSSSSGSTSSSTWRSSEENGLSEMQFMKRNKCSYGEIENSIQSAIAHCKGSQEQFHSRKGSVGDVRFCSLQASMVVCEDHERQRLCRG